MKLLLVAVFLGTFKVTSYRSVPEQTDSSPYITATGERVCNKGIAVSQDMLKKNGGALNYGDLVYVESVGFKFINDSMNSRHKQRFDIWVSTLEEEKKFHKRFKNKPLKVYVIKYREERSKEISVK